MAEHIEKSAVLAMIDAYAEENRKYGFNGFDIFDIDMMKMRIEHMTTADVAPVVHGKWEQVDDTKCRCSRCDIIALIGLYPHGDKNYCPNCGAKMDGVDSE